MAQPKYTIYKYVRLKDGSWRYCRAAIYANHTIKPNVVTGETLGGQLLHRLRRPMDSPPRDSHQGPSRLAEAAGVSVMSAFRFVEEFSKEGFLESGGAVLRLVRLRELLNRWVGAS